MIKTRLKIALNNPIWKKHVRNKSTYSLEGKKGTFKIVYYPLFRDGKTGDVYSEPRALVQNIDKPGFWHQETPLRYLELNPPDEQRHPASY